MKPTRSQFRTVLDIGMVIVFLALVFVPWGSLFSSKISLSNQLAWPSSEHWLGTDNLGRDLLVRLSETVRSTVLPLWGGILAMVFAGTVLAALVGASARGSSFFQNAADTVVSGTAGIPVAIFAFFLAVLFETNRMWMVVVSIGFILGVHSYLYLRGLGTRSERLGYWAAHDALGGRKIDRILQYGICSHWLRDLSANTAFYLKVAITVEASLSYLGFGVQEPQPSFGNMLASHFESYMRGNWMVLVVITGGLVLCSAVPAAIVRLSSLQIRSVKPIPRYESIRA